MSNAIEVPQAAKSPTLGSIAIVALSATFATSDSIVAPVWPTRDAPAYLSSQIASSYSEFEQRLIIQSSTPIGAIGALLSQLYASLLSGQEALGSDFEAVWDQNVDELYES